MLQLARPADRAAVNTLAGQVHAMHVSWRPDLFEMVEERYSEERFFDALHQRQLYVAKEGELIFGYVLLKIRDYDIPGLVKRKVMVIDEICVDEAFRRQGIGSRILTDVKALAKAFGCRDLQLGVYPQNDGAVTFYQKNGFMIRSIDMQMKL